MASYLKKVEAAGMESLEKNLLAELKKIGQEKHYAKILRSIHEIDRKYGEIFSPLSNKLDIVGADGAARAILIALLND